MKFEALKDFITNRLKTELAPELLYHSFEHTMGVYETAIRYAQAEKITGEDLTLLLTAALFHDSGFLFQMNDHEEKSCEIALSILPEYDYSAGQIERICGMIRATRVPQQPQNHLEQILCDADLDYLGGEDYDRISNHLYDELKIAGIVKSEQQWVDIQIRFMENHHFHTASAKQWREEGKANNLWKIKTKAGLHASLPAHAFSKTLWRKENFKEFGLVLLGILAFTFGLKGLLIPNHFFDGGVTGISLLLHEYYGGNIALIIIIANIPFILFGATQVGAKFAVKTSLAMLVLGLSLLFLPVEMISHDKLIVSAFGGFFIGLGVGLGMHGGCALDGIEILASYTWKKLGFSLSEIILGMNSVIFLIAAFHFGLEKAFYSMLTYFVASRTIDYVVEGIEEYTGMTIVSAGRSDEIKEYLVEQLGRGITVYKGERGFMKGNISESHPCDIIYTVVTRLEVRRLRNNLHEIDPKAFITTSSIKEATGGILKKKARH